MQYFHKQLSLAAIAIISHTKTTRKHRLTFVVETIDSVDGCTLMVASEKEEIFWIFDLVGQEETYGFQGLFTTVDVIS